MTFGAGAWQKFVKRGLNDNYFPIWVTNNGYNAYYTGKFQNGQSVASYGKDAANAQMKGWTSADSEYDDPVVVAITKVE